MNKKPVTVNLYSKWFLYKLIWNYFYLTVSDYFTKSLMFKHELMWNTLKLFNIYALAFIMLHKLGKSIFLIRNLK
mgnify:CR=1 FL=1